MEAALLGPAPSRDSRWVRPVPAPPYGRGKAARERTAVPPGSAATPETPDSAQDSAVTAGNAGDMGNMGNTVAPRGGTPRSARPRVERGRPDPCATFKDVRRDYCHQVLDDLTR
ncbi:hypothetical protein [Nonomuraea africana]|uniref:hypothetical protein n=1 Tax=Nonomuraea africana TaxID=46171 RepID=UPI00340D619A